MIDNAPKINLYTYRLYNFVEIRFFLNGRLEVYSLKYWIGLYAQYYLSLTSDNKNKMV